MDSKQYLTKRNIIVGSFAVTVALAALFLPTQDAEAFFGDSDSNGNWFNDITSDFLSDSSGAGKGKGSAEGNFSMNINASGKADTYAYTDMDNVWKGNGSGESHANKNDYDYGFYH